VETLGVAKEAGARAKSAKGPHFRALAALSERSESERQGAVATQRGNEGYSKGALWREVG
jgi:hypothetical protein